MQEPIENISRLQMKLNDLQLENQILKNILDNAGISYRQELLRLHAAEEFCEYDPDQGARIQTPAEITEKNGSLQQMEKANQGAILNPCPPFFRGEEVSEDVINSDYFVGYGFKKCLITVQQAILCYLLDKKWYEIFDRRCLE